MGLYDEERYDTNVSLRLMGDAGMARQFIPFARKIVEKVRGSLEQGTNLGMGVAHSVSPQLGTTVEIRVHPGVTNPMVDVTITSIPEVEEPEEGYPIAGYTQCPPSPHGRPGARMFTELFGHTVFGDQVFDQQEVPLFVDSWTEPAGGTSINYRYGEIVLPRPIRFQGLRAEEVTIFPAGVGFGGHRTVATGGGPSYSAPPCERGVGDGFTLFDPGGVSNAGNEDLHDYVLIGNSLHFSSPEEQPTIDSLVWMISGNTTQTSIIGQPSTDAQGISQPRKLTGTPADGGLLVPRTFTAFQFGAHPSQDLGAQAEIVFLDAGFGCPAQLGIFYGGLDGSAPWQYGWADDGIDGWCGPTSFPDLTIDTYIGRWICENVPGSCVFNAFAPSHASFRAAGGINAGQPGGNLLSMYYDGRESENLLGNGSSFFHLNSRSFWMDLDPDGFFTGSGSYQAPLSFQDDIGFTVDDVAFPT